LPFKLVLKYNAFLPCFLANKERLNGKAKDDFKNFIKKMTYCCNKSKNPLFLQPILAR